MSGVNAGHRRVRKGATSAIAAYVQSEGGTLPSGYLEVSDRFARSGGTPLGVADGGTILGIINLKDRVKANLAERFAQLHNMAVRTVLITGDNPVTAAAIAREIGVDDILPQSTPADKLSFIKAQQSKKHVVAMSGDGSNDAPALAQADVGFVMNTGTLAAKEAGHLIDLESDPAKMLDVITIGKQLYLTRVALASFSFAFSLGQGLAVLPALFSWFPVIRPLNLLGIEEPRTAVLAAVIWNALSTIALLRFAWWGVKLHRSPLRKLLWRYAVLYGLAGLLLPFPAIWVLGRLLEYLHLT
jgi:K+-transporting ATPase ATPase B chain